MDAVQVEARGTGAVPVNIASGATVSDAFDAEGFEIVGVWLPANFTGTTLGFMAAEKPDGTYQTVRNSSGDISLTVAAGRVCVLPTSDTLPFLRFLKLVVASQGSAVRAFVLRKQGGG